MLIKMRMVKEVLSEPLNLCTLACVIKKNSRRRRWKPRISKHARRKPSSHVRMLRRVETFRFRSYTRAIVVLLPEKYEYPRSGEASAPVIVRRFHPLSWEKPAEVGQDEGRTKKKKEEEEDVMVVVGSGRSRGWRDASSRKNGSTPGSG